MRRFTIGDIHGRYKALKEVLTKSKFNYDKDLLICLGDVVDGGINTYKVVEELLKIKNLIYIIGNHDEWFMNHMSTGWAEKIWLHQGGNETLKSYGGNIVLGNSPFKQGQGVIDLIDTTDINIPVTHQDFFNRGIYYYELDKMLFVHGGFNPLIPIKEQHKNYILWDRDIIQYAQMDIIKGYDKIFIGHTTTQKWSNSLPVRFNNLIMVDCGAGYNGRLCLMNIDTEKHYLSKFQEGGR